MSSTVTSEPAEVTSIGFGACDFLSYESTEERFLQLAGEWKDRTAYMSSLSDMKAVPAYREIVRMGKKIIPLLLDALEHDPYYWFLPLGEITGENPVPASSRGKIREMIQAWLHWGHENGYRW